MEEDSNGVLEVQSGKRGKLELHVEVSDEISVGWMTTLPEAMRLLSWNCQGLGNLWTIRNLHKLVRDQAPTVCF